MNQSEEQLEVTNRVLNQPENDNSASDNPADDVRPLSYGDLRRFLGLVATLAIAALLIGALGPTLLLFAVVFLLAMVLNPLVTGLEKRGLKRGLAVMLVMFSLIGIVAMLLFLVVPPLLEEINRLVQKVPVYSERIQAQVEQLSNRYPSIDRAVPKPEVLIETLRSQATRVTPWLLASTLGVVGAIFGLVVALLLLIFILSNPQPIVAGLLSVVPNRHREATRRSMARMMHQMTAWSRATLINGLITGVSTGILLQLVGVRPALVFGVLAFFGEFVPNIGPLVASVPALFVALGTSPQTAGMALIAILFVQQIESNVLVPFIMGKSMELHPVAIVFFALAMGSLFGVVGAVLAVPTAALVRILLDEFYLRPRRAELAGVQDEANQIICGTGAENTTAGTAPAQPA
jgi:predicted PurR-regulated permease PerM